MIRYLGIWAFSVLRTPVTVLCFYPLFWVCRRLAERYYQLYIKSQCSTDQVLFCTSKQSTVGDQFDYVIIECSAEFESSILQMRFERTVLAHDGEAFRMGQYTTKLIVVEDTSPEECLASVTWCHLQSANWERWKNDSGRTYIIVITRRWCTTNSAW